MNKLTYKYVKDFFEEHGCELLVKEYKNNKTRLKYKCSCGNIGKIQFGNFQQGQRCWECGNKNKNNKRRLSFEYVKYCFEKNGCELLEDRYINSRTKMNYRCACGKIDKVTFKHCNNFIRCKKCGTKECSGKNHYRWIADRAGFEQNKRFKQKCYSMLRKTLTKTCQRKKDRTHKMLGYTVAELQDYICNHFNWGKIKDEKWHLDHIFPIQAFLDYGIKDVKLMNCLNNLQPLGYRENISKSDNYCEEEFEKWLKGKKYDF